SNFPGIANLSSYVFYLPTSEKHSEYRSKYFHEPQSMAWRSYKEWNWEIVQDSPIEERIAFKTLLGQFRQLPFQTFATKGRYFPSFSNSTGSPIIGAEEGYVDIGLSNQLGLSLLPAYFPISSSPSAIVSIDKGALLVSSNLKIGDNFLLPKVFSEGYSDSTYFRIPPLKISSQRAK
ncbi:MAG: hypothetical protein AAGC85_00820, partial [Bacteroidota bacterium]